MEHCRLLGLDSSVSGRHFESMKYQCIILDTINYFLPESTRYASKADTEQSASVRTTMPLDMSVLYKQELSID